MNRFALILLAAFAYACSGPVKLECKPDHSEALIHGRPYVSGYYVKKGPGDSVQHFYGRIFYANGVYRMVTFSAGAQHPDSLKHSLEVSKSHRPGWGVYEVGQDSIILKGWTDSKGYRAIEMVALLQSNKTMQVTRSRRIRSRPSQWYRENTVFRFRPIPVRGDSVTGFITSP